MSWGERTQWLGQQGLGLCRRLGQAGQLLPPLFWGRVGFKQGYLLLVRQIYNVGVLSLPIVVVSGLFIGMVLGLQGYTTLATFGAEQALGQLIALSLVRELGPVVAALLFAGRAGSALTAEIALMKATEQLDSLAMMAVSPIQRVIAPRFWAGQLAMPWLAMIFSATAIWGGHLVAVAWLHVDGGAFWSNMQASVDFVDDVWNGILKSLCFGFVVTWIAVFQGWAARATPEGIAIATTRTVVFSSLAVLGLDFLLTAWMFGGLA